MARKSRKNKIAGTPGVSIQKEIIYRSAVYARLSVEDNGVSGDSIENQIFLLEKYIQDKPYLIHCGTYLDNGETGTNFNRPGFTALMKDIRSGKINCVIVKDAYM